MSRYLVTVPKHGKKRKESSPKTSPKKATSPKQAQEQETITKASGEIVLAPEAQVKAQGGNRGGRFGPQGATG